MDTQPVGAAPLKPGDEQGVPADLRVDSDKLEYADAGGSVVAVAIRR